MRKLSSIAVIWLAALCLFQLQPINASLQVYQESLNYPNRRVIFTPYYFTSETLVYALCDKNFQAHENHCTVIRQNHLLRNETISCNVTLKTEQEDGSLGPKYEILPFGEDKAIFISAEKSEEAGEDTFIKLSTIQLNTCKVSETKVHVNFPYETALVFVVPYHDSFKVIFENRAQCGGRMCVMAVDSNGRKFGNLAFISKTIKPRSFPIAAPVGKSTFDRKLFFIKSERRKNYAVWKSDGSENSLVRYAYKSRSSVLSTANDFISVCHDMLSGDSKIICTQHDINGQLKFEFTSSDGYEQLKLRSLYNLPNGGLLLLADCIDGFLVIKIDSSGKMVGSFNIEDFYCSSATSGIGASFYKHENENYCVSMACREGDDFYILKQSSLNLVTACFTDVDFTNSHNDVAF